MYNSERYLSECLEYVVNQNYDNFEVICVNDGSTDSSAEILESFATHVSFLSVLNQENKGMSAARNMGLKLAKGDYVLFVDSDDLLVCEALSNIDAKITDEDILAYNASTMKMPSKIKNADEGFDASFSSGWDYYNQYALMPRKIHFVCIWQRAYRRDFLLKNNLFFVEHLKKAEDDLFTTMACYYAATVKIISENLYVYRLHESNISFSQDKKRLADTVFVLNNLSRFFVDKSINKSAIYRILASGYINCFSSGNVHKYGVTDSDVKEMIDMDLFGKVCISKKHRWLHFLIGVHPCIFRLWNRLVLCVHR